WLGYWLLRKNKPIMTGLAWSIRVLKPQFAMAAGVVMVMHLLERRWKTIAGFLTLVILFCAINVSFFSLSLFNDWLRCLKLSDAVYSNLKYGVASHLMICLPRAV